jgi:pimeloyl-ACP methyl ester carboxylesterase
MVKSLPRPSLLWFLSEPGRALTELAIAVPFKSTFKNDAIGDGHPVMMLPGFMSNGASTIFLRKFIKKLGYNVIDWGLGRNLGKVEYIDLLLESVDELYAKTNEPISLIGWSLGGVFARQIAKQRPDIIRQVITLGSPFAGITQPNNASWIYTLVSGGKKVKNINIDFLNNLPNPASVPTTAIYTKEDGIVHWETCIEADQDEIHQNVQVRGSHIGLGVNPSVLSIIADRLKYDRNNWKYFEPKGIVENIFCP